MAITRDKARSDAFLDPDLTGRNLLLGSEVSATTEPKFFEGSVASNFYITGTFDGATVTLGFTPNKSLPLTPIDGFDFIEADLGSDLATGNMNYSLSAGFYGLIITDAGADTAITAYVTGAIWRP